MPPTQKSSRWFLFLLGLGLLGASLLVSRQQTGPPLGKKGAGKGISSLSKAPPSPDGSATLGASRTASTLVVVFVPSITKTGEPIDQKYWVDQTLATMGKLLGGATAFPPGKGVWRDDRQSGKLHYDEPVVIHSYTTEQDLQQHGDALRTFLVRMGTETQQGSVGVVIDRDFHEIRIPTGK